MVRVWWQSDFIVITWCQSGMPCQCLLYPAVLTTCQLKLRYGFVIVAVLLYVWHIQKVLELSLPATLLTNNQLKLQSGYGGSQTI